MQQQGIKEKKRISTPLLEKLRKAGRLPKLKTERVELLPHNYEVVQIAYEHLDAFYSDYTGRFKVIPSEFVVQSKMFKHKEIKRNYIKLCKLKDALNEELRKNQKNKKKK